MREALSHYSGVPTWWAELFVDIGLSVEEAVAWVRTAETDGDSVLRRIRDKEMNSTLQGYARARGIALMGAGDGDVENPSAKTDRLVHRISTVVTPQEQAAIIAEVGLYADVEFREKVNGVYTQHGVANAVRAVHGAYLTKVAGDALVLEAGASLKSAVLAGVDPATRHCCCPVLDVRDSVRHSLRGWLQYVARTESRYSDRVRETAMTALDPESGFVCQKRAQDCTKQVEVICTNESTHDVPFDDLPLIMARHGARLWTGFMTRAPGVRSRGGPVSGISSALGTRWKLNREKDEIVFHFNKDSSFSYTHKFSQWVKYEEQFGFRWRGQYFDYVYTRLPITTASCLAFVIARVPKATDLLREPVYKESGQGRLIRVTSIRAVGGCLGVKKPKFEPCTFEIQDVVFDRALETRLAQGTRGNLASTMAYLRSARVKLAINGVELGAVTTVPTEQLEPAAVAIEVLAADFRQSGERDYSQIMRVAATDVAFAGIASYFDGVRSVVGAAATAAQIAVRGALASVLNGTTPIVVKAERCPLYVKVNDGLGEGHVTTKPELKVTGCGCSELTAVSAALKSRGVLGRSERRELEAYARELRSVVDVCVVHDVHRVEESEAADVFYDAEEDASSGTGTEATTSTDAFGVGSAAESLATAATSECEHLCVDGDVVSEPELGEGGVVTAMREYAKWAQLADRCARSEAALNASVMFLVGNPTTLDVERATTARTRHAIVFLKGGSVEKVVGTLREEESFAEVYVRSLNRTCKVYVEKSGRKYIRENVTELAYTSNGLSVVNGDELARGVMSVLCGLPRGFSIPKHSFVMGVPGAGKTYEAQKLMERAVGEGKSVMYLTATTAGREEVERHMVAKLGKDCIVFKTYDSYVINGAVPVGKGSVDLLIMDEAPKVHKGEIFACIAKACAAEVRLYGDAKQIPWLPFMADFNAQHAQMGDEFVYEYRHMTHRFGAATCAMWLDVYGTIYPCDCCEHEDVIPVVEKITSAVGVPAVPEGKVLVFTQEERMTMKREGGFTATVAALKSRDKGGLSTVAEDQGGTHPDVAIVRLVNKKNPKESSKSPSIWNREPWVLVATTRHKRRLCYYTVADDDLVCARIDLSRCPVRLEAVKNRASWKTIEHRVVPVRKFGVTM